MARRPVEFTIPRGIKLRELKDGSRIQIAFSFEGQECRELLPLGKINKGFIDYASGLRSEIKRKIKDGTFRYEEYFPNSNRNKDAAPNFKMLTVGDLLKKQLKTYERQSANGNLSASTLLGYSKAINGRLLPAFQNKKLSELTPTVLREWVAGLGVTAKTVRNAMTPLRSVLDDAVNDELILFNPLDRIALRKLLKQTSTKSEYVVDPFDMDEVKALLTACRNDERSMIKFWIATGLRTGELIALSWPSVDWVHKTVRVEANQVQGLQNGKVQSVKKTPKTEAGKRDVDLSKDAIDALSDQKSVTFLEGGQIWRNPRTDLPWESDSQIRRTLWEPLCKRAGVRYRNPYQMRHTYASTLLTAGANPFWLAPQMGHVDVEMIFKTYGKWIPKNFQKSGVQIDTRQHAVSG